MMSVTPPDRVHWTRRCQWYVKVQVARKGRTRGRDCRDVIISTTAEPASPSFPTSALGGGFRHRRECCLLLQHLRGVFLAHFALDPHVVHDVPVRSPKRRDEK